MRKRDLSDVAMFKSAKSGPNGECVQFGRLPDNTVVVCNSRDDGDGVVLSFTPGEWDAFTQAAASGKWVRA